MLDRVVRELQLARITVISAVSLTLIVVGLFLQPAPLFAHSIQHSQFTVRSDRPLGKGWEAVLGDVQRRLKSSDLYDENAKFRIFICNQPWRLWLFTRNGEVGGFADTIFTRNIYLRETVVAENRIVPPRGTLADADVRPLSYFIAHEAVHVMQSRNFGRMVSINSPKWLVEGYADYVAKAGDFHFENNRRLLIDGDQLLSNDSARRGLYRRYHLMVQHSLRTTEFSVYQLFADPPNELDILTNLKSDSSGDKDT